ncbi:MAG TPA: transposase [Terriglobales bacterium]|nr:transposase [Terriglobales bacterium]
MKTPLLDAWLDILRAWSPIFAQSRSAQRALDQALGGLLALGRRTLSRSLCALGRQHQDWSAHYKLHSRARWHVQDLFQPVLQKAAPLCADALLIIAMDDTRIRKTGRKILSAFYQRDPLSPKFRFNLMWGLRFLHFSLLVPLYNSRAEAPPRALPVRFLEVPALKKPGKKSSADQRQAYQQAVKEHNLSRSTVTLLQGFRQSADAVGLHARTVLAVGDGSFCNRTLFRQTLDRTQILSRARRDCRLCHAAPAGSRRFYATEVFTPEQIRQRESLPWQQARIFHGGQWREVRYKEVPSVYWRSGAGRRSLRLLVVAPIPYSAGKARRKYYGQPAFLLTTDSLLPAATVLQAYFDRWQIEVNHREIKDTLGIGQAQLRNPRAVPRQPAMLVAAYSALLLAAIQVFGEARAAAFPSLPKWRRNARRPSCLDLVTVLRQEVTSAHASGAAVPLIDPRQLVLAASA